jgi:hypothetical protein
MKTRTPQDQTRRSKIAAQSERQSHGSEQRRARRKRIDQLRAELEYRVAIRYSDLPACDSWGKTRGSK